MSKYFIAKSPYDKRTVLTRTDDLELAKKCRDACNPYFVYDESGKQVYPENVENLVEMLKPQ